MALSQPCAVAWLSEHTEGGEGCVGWIEAGTTTGAFEW